MVPGFAVYSSPFGSRLGERLRIHLSSGNWKSLTVAVAWAKMSGVSLIQSNLLEFIATGGIARLAVGIDSKGTTLEALDTLNSLLSAPSELRIVNHRSQGVTYHPKVYLFENESHAVALLGSGNLTAGGLSANFELGAELEFDFGVANDCAAFEALRGEIERFLSDTPISKSYDNELRATLVARGEIPTEQEARPDPADVAGRADPGGLSSPFGTIPLPPPLRVGEPRSQPRAGTHTPVEVGQTDLTITPRFSVRGLRGFAMTLQRTDVGVGQTGTNTAKRSPEIFIPLAARDADPTFWGWDELFQEHVAGSGKFDRVGVRFLLNGTVHEVNMMTWPAKHDFRLRNEALRSSGSVGDVLVIERLIDDPVAEYAARVIPQGDVEYEGALALCANVTHNSPRKWGYFS